MTTWVAFWLDRRTRTLHRAEHCGLQPVQRVERAYVPPGTTLSGITVCRRCSRRR